MPDTKTKPKSAATLSLADFIAMKKVITDGDHRRFVLFEVIVDYDEFNLYSSPDWSVTRLAEKYPNSAPSIFDLLVGQIIDVDKYTAIVRVL